MIDLDSVTCHCNDCFPLSPFPFYYLEVLRLLLAMLALRLVCNGAPNLVCVVSIKSMPVKVHVFVLLMSHCVL